MRSIKRLTNLLISRNPKKQNYENNKIYSEEKVYSGIHDIGPVLFQRMERGKLRWLKISWRFQH